jgi:HlyD family secretion protein
VVLGLALVAVSLVVGLWIVSVDKKPPAAPPLALKRIPVEVRLVKPETFTHWIELLGTIKPLREVTVAPEVAGQVVDVPEGIELGAWVEEGELLARIKTTSFEIALKEAEALLTQKRAAYEEQRRESEKREALYRIAQENLELVRADTERLEALFKKGVVSRSEMEAARQRLTGARSEFEELRSLHQSADASLRRAEAEIAQAEALVAKAREDLANTRVRAPFRGIIVEKDCEVGDHVSVGQGLFRLVDISRVKVLVHVPSIDIHAVAPGARAKVSLASFPDRPFRGYVAHVGYEGQLENRTFPVEVLVENPPDMPLRPGMFASVKIAVGTYENVILVERRLLQASPDGPALFVADPKAQVARKRLVRLGRLFGERYQVVKGLKPGELLILEGIELLSDEAPIKLLATGSVSTR